MAMSAVKERWWPTRAPPTSRSTDVVMDLERREVVSNTTVRLLFHDVELAVVCQEGCYPEKASHVNQDCFLVQPNFGDDPSQLLLGVFDGHGGNGEHCAQIAASIFPKKLAARRDPVLRQPRRPRRGRPPSWNGTPTSPFSRTPARSWTPATPSSPSSATAPNHRHHRRRRARHRRHAPHGQRGRLARHPRRRKSRGLGRRLRSMGRRGGDARPDLFPKRRARAHAQGRDQTRDVRHPRDAFGRDPLERRLRPGVHRGGGRSPSRLQKRSLLPRVRVHAAPSATPPANNSGCARNPSSCPINWTGPVDASWSPRTACSSSCPTRRYSPSATARGNDPERRAPEIVRDAYENWATEDTRSDDVTCVVAYFTPKTGAKEAPTIAGFGLPSSPAKRNWNGCGTCSRTRSFKIETPRRQARFADAVLAKAAMDLRRRRGSLAMEELFPNFDWEKMSELQKHGSRKEGWQQTHTHTHRQRETVALVATSEIDTCSEIRDVCCTPRAIATVTRRARAPSPCRAPD